MVGNKHAYLLLVHQDTLVLRRLIALIDDAGNDIFVHIDKKVKRKEKIKEKLAAIPKQSNIYFLSKYRVFWGTNSIMDAECALLKRAVAGQYSYYHILSGADLPIKPQNDIHKFFEEHAGKEFIHFGTASYQRDIQSRYNVYHFFTKQLGRKRDKKVWNIAETYSLAIQRRLHVDRLKKLGFSFYGGANWCSITNGFANYIVKNGKKYKKAFRFSQISDEAIFQTIVMDSPFQAQLYLGGHLDDYKACLRYIDWNRGNPYVFRKEDYDELIKSPCMFARKFDEDIDKEIIDILYQTLREKV